MAWGQKCKNIYIKSFSTSLEEGWTERNIPITVVIRDGWNSDIAISKILSIKRHFLESWRKSLTVLIFPTYIKFQETLQSSFV